ncbi:MAG: hypothetical protein K2X41_00285 [Hyphomicrobium sp.]|nr:hypothetical protein [Hyphomicrobium sp.]
MAVDAPRAPLAVYMLADHLDAALAAGEDLIARGADWRQLAEQPGDNVALFAAAQRDIAEDVRSFELMLTARILKAREHARALGTIDARFAAVANLFVSGTGLLLDAVDEAGDARGLDFDSGDGLVAYIRGRGLIAPHAAGISHPAQLTIDDSFRVAKRIALGPLLDMAGAFLDALDTHYDLFVVGSDRDARSTATVTAAAEMPSKPPSFGRLTIN